MGVADERSLLGDKNRRHFFRHSCDASVTTAFEYDREDKWNRNVRKGYLRSDAIGQTRLQVLNISEGGAAIVSRFPAVKGALVSLRISTAFDTTIRATARVAWVKRPRMLPDCYVLGLEFVQMSRDDVRKLNDFLRLLPEPSPARDIPPERS
ncbi:MAG: PilZ domain-containing protein [Candidatus Abyssobacteria bacterium SURF_17]|uniref:PilZ domain-containing protein n=1 Tax=Candidatus Abyssobacteria bacterium SURF_17 TaxID=2093361 RepID=A0A419ENN7_9BACT|nr:MAG: PilZ domain-containing protein [Candidatus Abyssubacteria bacterium SURF_17]